MKEINMNEKQSLLIVAIVDVLRQHFLSMTIAIIKIIIIKITAIYNQYNYYNHDHYLSLMMILNSQHEMYNLAFTTTSKN